MLQYEMPPTTTIVNEVQSHGYHALRFLGRSVVILHCLLFSGHRVWNERHELLK